MQIQIIPENDGPGLPEATIRSWEAETGQTLPDAYVAMLAQVNGGFPYPNVVFLDLPESFSVYRDGAFLGMFYDWESALSFYAGDTYGAGTPPGMFFFGNEPGGLEYLISLRSHDHGTVYAWAGSANVWGDEGNDESALFAQAPSFVDFIAKLTDTPDKMGLEEVGEEDLAEDAITVTFPDP